MHAVVDSERKSKNQLIARQLQHRHETREAGLVGARDERLVGTVTNLEHQMGRRLSGAQFMAKLRKLNKDLVMLPHPNRNNPKPEFAYLDNVGLIYLQVGDQNIYLFPTEWDWMPEWETMRTASVKRPGVGEYWNEVEVPGRTHRRGWRTVLRRLIEKRIITLDAAEREFGAGDRASWATMRQDVQAPV
jgi:hypothetical protein